MFSANTPLFGARESQTSAGTSDRRRTTVLRFASTVPPSPAFRLERVCRKRNVKHRLVTTNAIGVARITGTKRRILISERNFTNRGHTIVTRVPRTLGQTQSCAYAAKPMLSTNLNQLLFAEILLTSIANTSFASDGTTLITFSACHPYPLTHF